MNYQEKLSEDIEKYHLKSPLYRPIAELTQLNQIMRVSIYSFELQHGHIAL